MAAAPEAVRPEDLINALFKLVDLLRDGAFAISSRSRGDFAMNSTVRQHKAIRGVVELTKEKPQGITLKELAEYLNISPAATCEVVESLVRKDALCRTQNTQDRRSVNITLSTLSSKLIDDIDKYFASCASMFLQDLDRQKQLELINQLQNFYDTLNLKGNEDEK